jgi:GTP cyclohydrolase II
MSFAPDIVELLARARADLRMGVPVVLCNDQRAVLVLAVETLSAARLKKVRRLAGDVVVAITLRRAQTLKAMVYDGDLARVRLPGDADVGWVQSIADPTDDLIAPMKGPLTIQRGGDAELHRLGLKLAKSARLLPAVLVVQIEDGHAFALEHHLTCVDQALTAPHLADSSPLRQVISARLPLAVSEAGRPMTTA